MDRSTAITRAFSLKRLVEESAAGRGQVEFQFGELFPRVGYIVTNLAASNRAVVCGGGDGDSTAKPF